MELFAYMIANLAGDDWPADAVYAMHYDVQAWPTNARRNIAYFRNISEVKKFFRDMREFVRYEDNYYTPIRFEKWNLGPVVIRRF